MKEEIQKTILVIATALLPVAAFPGTVILPMPVHTGGGPMPENMPLAMWVTTNLTCICAMVVRSIIMRNKSYKYVGGLREGQSFFERMIWLDNYVGDDMELNSWAFFMIAINCIALFFLTLLTIFNLLS